MHPGFEVHQGFRAAHPGSGAVHPGFGAIPKFLDYTFCGTQVSELKLKRVSLCHAKLNRFFIYYV